MRWIAETVARLRRQREEATSQLRMVGGRRVRRRRRVRPAERAARQAERLRLAAASPRPVLPLSTTSLLELDKGCDAVVVDGQILQVLWCSPKPGEPAVVINRSARACRCLGRLDERLQSEVLHSWQDAFRWARDQQAAGTLSLPPLGERVVERVERFVWDQLIPRLRREAGDHGAPGCRPSADPPAAARPRPKNADRGAGPDLQLLSELARRARVDLPAAWPRAFAYVGRQWCDLVPFHGRPRPGQLHLRRDEQDWVEGSRLPRRQAVAQQDQRLAAALLHLLEPLCPRAGEPETVYGDDTHAVLRTSPQHYFCCRRIPAYAVEGEDRVLYRFEPVQIGVWLLDVEVRKVIHPLAVTLMHPYQHMFVFGGGTGASVCMPRPDRYYSDLCAVPLEEALLRHLESARMTLCSGYHEGNTMTRFHDIRRLGRPRITAAEAQQQGLPIYPYYRDEATPADVPASEPRG